jgi:hypothetical protein
MFKQVTENQTGGANSWVKKHDIKDVEQGPRGAVSNKI